MDISIGSYKVRLEILLLIVILFWIIFGHAMCSCSTMSAMEGFQALENMVGSGKKQTPPPNPNPSSKKEGFTSGNNTAMSESQFASTNSPDWYMPPSKWPQQTLVYTAGQKPPPGVASIWNRSKTQPPKKPGQLSFFDNILFKPECCSGSDSSSSMGCACYTVEDYNYLKTRVGNNVPFSDM